MCFFTKLHRDDIGYGFFEQKKNRGRRRGQKRWHGRTLIGIDKWYPSSKRCSGCGFVVSKMPLSVRSWTCPECAATHDRDINAARNILAAGLAASALGESVNPALAYA